jgi:hypothetical protein
MQASMFVICLSIRLYTPSSNDSLIITNKPKAEENICTATKLLLYILHTHKNSKISCHISLQDAKVSYANVAPTSNVRVSAMVLLITTWN